MQYYPYFPPGMDISQYWDVNSVPIIGKRNRCKGCGRFMPKDLEKTTYVNISNEPCHMNEKCMEKALEGKEL